MPHVDLDVHPLERLDVTRACALPQGKGQGVLRLRVQVRRPAADHVDRRVEIAPGAKEAADVVVRLLLGDPERIVGSPDQPGKRAPQDQRRRPFRMGRGEEKRHRTTLRRAEEDGPGRPDGVHDCTYVVHTSLQRGDPDSIGHARAALVEADQATGRLQPAYEVRQRGLLPGELDVRDEALHPDDVERPVARHLIGDRDITAPRIPGARRHGRQSGGFAGPVQRSRWAGRLEQLCEAHVPITAPLAIDVGPCDTVV